MKLQELKERAFKNKEVKEHYENLKPFFKIQEQLIQARIDSKLTQEQIAQRMNVKQSFIARLENTTNGCNVKTLIDYARSVGLKKITIEL